MMTASFFCRFDLDEVPGQEVDVRQYLAMQFKGVSWKVDIRRRIKAS